MNYRAAPDTVDTFSNRQRYLLHTLKLNHDPFAFATAELELQENAEDPPFFLYFVPPVTATNEDLLELLRQAKPAFVYGAPGSGKTTLRYALEAICRAMPDRTLVVSYTIGKNDTPVASTADLWALLTESLAIDLFVQVVEQLHTLPTLSPETIRSLAEFWYVAIPHYGRNLRRHLEQTEPHRVNGISTWWTLWRRAVVRYTPLTPERIAFFRQLIALEKSVTPKPISNANFFEHGLLLAQLLGFQQLFFLVDVVDSSQRQSVNLTDHLTLLFQEIRPLTSPIPFYPKFFLPESWQNRVNNLATSLDWLTPQSLSAIMQWDNLDALQSIIHNRFRSSGTWIREFNAIAGQDIAGQLDQLMVKSAQQSPRRLMQVASLLIDAHAHQDAKDPLITSVDWQHMCNMWGDRSPLPIPPYAR